MTIFKDLSKKITDTAKEAAKKSSKFVEITKLSLQMDKNQKDIEQYFFEMGKSLYENYKDDSWVKDRFGARFASITELHEENEKLRKEIVKLKDSKICSTCGEELGKEVIFCSKCGTKCAGDEAGS